VSRLFAHFQKDKLVVVNRRKIELVDLPKLHAMVKGCVGKNRI